MTRIEVNVNGQSYRADVENGRVTIYRDGVWSGVGRWNGVSIEDCPASLGDEAYDAIEAALVAAGARCRPTYAEYWTAVFGERSPTDVVSEFGLSEYGLDEWVGHNEDEAERQGLTLDDEWSAKVRAELREALGH